ncbi:MAG: hypothetical protein K6A90_04150, partial [Lachnospiraceae bacterium]|nr:hypothetical protein [Lachnospiraceae bacterium]
SEYCKQIFKNENLKSRKWVKEYFRNIDDLVHSIQMYDHVSDVRKGEYITGSVERLNHFLIDSVFIA